ncbi:hypothetical protein POVCU2_0018680 [Plasmodium ovale curtisi]|uniref:Uncharacterized protein n=1 Tax=Plasmodium ovale curtisi TaxID=864141 RepID=A0A1A8VUM4_PLAOA|nr:hypothetical protein POVCU2_0018680 [Plasmodium ovale curtisi]SBS89623.1 hypothetical protein POVCU1_016790 [Plasmodium ovale curtisi]
MTKTFTNKTYLIWKKDRRKKRARSASNCRLNGAQTGKWEKEKRRMNGWTNTPSKGLANEQFVHLKIKGQDTKSTLKYKIIKMRITN